MLTIQVIGPEHSGKGHLMVLIAEMLREKGLSVTVQGEQSHLHDKFEQAIVEHVDKLSDKKIVMIELQTGV